MWKNAVYLGLGAWLVLMSGAWAGEQPAADSSASSQSNRMVLSPAVQSMLEEADHTIAALETFKKRLVEKGAEPDMHRSGLHLYRRQMEDLRRSLEHDRSDGAMSGLQSGLSVPPAGPGRRGPHTGRWLSPPMVSPFSGPDDDFTLDPDAGFDSFFRDFQRMRDDMDRLMGRAMGRLAGPDGSLAGLGMGFSPSVDIQDAGDRYVVRMDVPGMDKADFSLEVKDQVLAVSGALHQDQEDTGQGYVRRERRFGQFQRSVLLPGPVDADKTEATYESGVLVVTLPKAGHEPVRKKVPVL